MDKSETFTVGDCVVCLETPASHVVVPCGHQCLCQGCAPQVTLCPVCRSDIQQCMRVFASGVVTEDSRLHLKDNLRDCGDCGNGDAETDRNSREKRVGSKAPACGRGSVRKRQMPNLSVGQGETGTAAGQGSDAARLAEVTRLRGVLDDPMSTDAALALALVGLETLGPFSAPLLRQTGIGRATNALAHRAQSAPVKTKARALVDSWKRSLVEAQSSQPNLSQQPHTSSFTGDLPAGAKRQRVAEISLSESDAERDGVSAEQAAAVEASRQRGQREQRCELEVMTVNLGRVASARLKRHAAAARKTNVTGALVLEECVTVEEASGSHLL